MNKINMNKRRIVKQIVESVVNKLLINEVEDKPKVTFINVQSLLNQGYKPEELFDEVVPDQYFDKVRLGNKWNFVDSFDGKLLSKKWFEMVWDFDINEIALVKLNGKLNFINAYGDFTSDKWFDISHRPQYGAYQIESEGKCNFVNYEGKTISSIWYDRAWDFNEGFAPVKLNGKGWNYINIEGKILSKQWFDEVRDFKNGFAIVYSNRKQKYINTEGKLIGDQWVEQAYGFKEGLGLVRIERGNWNFVNPNGEYLSEDGFDNANWFKNGLADVQINGKWHKIDKNGNIVE